MIECERDRSRLLALSRIEPQGNAAEGRDRQLDFHPHAAHLPAQHYAFAIEFHLPHLPVRPLGFRRVADGQCEWIKPPRATRSGRWDPAGLHVTPRTKSPSGIFFARYGREIAIQISESA